MRRLGPAFVLFILSPVIAELLSGSAPPAEFFHPFGFVVMLALYGSGAVLIREITLRWGRRWPTIITLGLAYGILEEGIMLKSFFDPGWPDVGLLGVYGRFWGVNWIWSLNLMLYHSIISIAIPIYLVEQIYAECRDEPWLGRRGMIGLSLLLFIVVLFGFTLMTPYRPPVMPYLLSVAVTVGLTILARVMPQTWLTSHSGRVSRPRWFGLLGFVAVAVFFFLLQIGLPILGVPVVVTVASIVGFVTVIFLLVRHMSGNGDWTDEHKLALVSGVLIFFALLAPLQELDASRPDNTMGMTLVGLAAIAFVVWIQTRMRKRLQGSKSAQPST
jgi:hypothetical protein